MWNCKQFVRFGTFWNTSWEYIYIGRSRFWLCTLYVFIEIYLFCLCFVSMQNFLEWWFFLLFFSSSKQKSVERTRCLFQTSNFGCTKAKSWEKEKKAHRKREWKRERRQRISCRVQMCTKTNPPRAIKLEKYKLHSPRSCLKSVEFAIENATAATTTTSRNKIRLLTILFATCRQQYRLPFELCIISVGSLDWLDARGKQ